MRICRFLTILLTSLTMSIVSSAQSVTGDWQGTLNVGSISLRLVFHISGENGQYKATMDSPDQGAKGIPVDDIKVQEQQITLTISQLMVKYNGTITADSLIAGTFTQGGVSSPLTLKRTVVRINRPQNPQPPYPYRSEEITFRNEQASINLAGTLTLPAEGGPFTAVILLTGSGIQDRDETIMEHKPFLVIADYLTRHGIAVLRFDDRGAGRSEGNPTTATTADFATDAEAALDYLKQRKEINASRIGFLGHSEGGCIAFHVAGKRKDVAFVVSLAGTGLPGDSILLYQNHVMARTLQMPEETWEAQNDMLKKIYDIAKSELSDKEAARMIVEAGKSVLPSTPAPEQTEVLKKQAQAITLPWMRYFLKYDPRTDLAKMHCHLLALNGEKDMQVEAEANLKAIKEASKSENGRRITIMQYPGLNHLFQHCQTGMVNEYARIEETISPEVLNDITTWINSLF